jgi:hypothetical protein
MREKSVQNDEDSCQTAVGQHLRGIPPASFRGYALRADLLLLKSLIKGWN